MMSRACPRFSLGRLLVTPAALQLITEDGYRVADLLERHARGDLGDLAKLRYANTEVNDDDAEASEPHSRLSAYGLSNALVLVLTEGDQPRTTVLLADEWSPTPTL